MAGVVWWFERPLLDVSLIIEAIVYRKIQGLERWQVPHAPRSQNFSSPWRNSPTQFYRRRRRQTACSNTVTIHVPPAVAPMEPYTNNSAGSELIPPQAAVHRSPAPPAGREGAGRGLLAWPATRHGSLARPLGHLRTRVYDRRDGQLKAGAQ